MRLVIAATAAALFFPLAALAQAPPVMPINQAFRAATITPSDSADLPGGVTLGLYNGNTTACNITMILQNDAVSVLWSNVASGIPLAVRAKRVFSSGTSCTGLLALYPQ